MATINSWDNQVLAANVLFNGGTFGVGTDATTNAISIGTGAAAHTLSIGSSSSGAITINIGSGNLALNGNGNTIGLANDAAANTVTLGSTNSTSATTVQSGSGALNITATNGALTIKSGTGTLAVGNDATAQTISFATGAGVKTLTIGSTNTTSQTTIQSGSNVLTLTTNGGNANIVLTPNGSGVISSANGIQAASISFDSGVNTISNYVNSGTWTPTIDGATPGTTTYTAQNGFYMRVGNLVSIFANIGWSAATGTGNAVIGALPFTIRNSTNYAPTGAVTFSATWTWPAAGTNMVVRGLANSTTCLIQTTGSATAVANLQMTNAAGSCNFSLTYFI